MLEDTGLQSLPTTDGPTETPTTDAHVCANGPIFHLSPGPVQPPQSFYYELDRPGCDTRAPCGVICTARAWLVYRTKAAAAVRSACGLGASPAPSLWVSARAAPRARKYRRAARLGCSGARWSRRSSTAAAMGFIRGHRAQVTTNNRRYHLFWAPVYRRSTGIQAKHGCSSRRLGYIQVFWRPRGGDFAKPPPPGTADPVLAPRSPRRGRESILWRSGPNPISPSCVHAARAVPHAPCGPCSIPTDENCLELELELELKTEKLSEFRRTTGEWRPTNELNKAHAKKNWLPRMGHNKPRAPKPSPGLCVLRPRFQTTDRMISNNSRTW
jgi:hypothetical protein